MSSSQHDFLSGALIQFYATSSYPCSYLPDRQARSQVATPAHLISPEIYSKLILNGFRRSGLFTYRPWCDHCQACIPVRIPVARLQPNRSQRRAIQKHSHLVSQEGKLAYDPAHYALYTRYQQTRHPGGGMDDDNLEQYTQFLLESPVDTLLIEFLEEKQLRMVSIVDLLTDGLSSVYTFFDPDLPGSAFGTYNILWQARLCQQLNLPYLYLGYWIKESQKMAYKANFSPLQGYINGVWQDLSPDETQ